MDFIVASMIISENGEIKKFCQKLSIRKQLLLRFAHLQKHLSCTYIFSENCNNNIFSNIQREMWGNCTAALNSYLLHERKLY